MKTPSAPEKLGREEAAAVRGSRADTKQGEMDGNHPRVPVTTVTINGLDLPVKSRHRQVGFKNPDSDYLQETHLTHKDSEGRYNRCVITRGGWTGMLEERDLKPGHVGRGRPVVLEKEQAPGGAASPLTASLGWSFQT